MLTIREACAEDAALISRIIARSWRGSYQQLIDEAYLSRLPEEYWLPSMRGWLAGGRMYGLIAEADECAVGCIIFGRGRDERRPDWGEIVSLYLLPERIGQGVGSRLLENALALLASDGYRSVYLWAIDGNDRADRFYRKHGFSRTDEQVPYRIGGRDVTDILYIREG